MNLGFSVIADAVRSVQEFGLVRRCPCQGGILTEIPATALVVTAVSNWGAHAVAAMLSAWAAKPDSFRTPELKSRIVMEYVHAGDADGASGELAFRVDGG